MRAKIRKFLLRSGKPKHLVIQADLSAVATCYNKRSPVVYYVYLLLSVNRIYITIFSLSVLICRSNITAYAFSSSLRFTVTQRVSILLLDTILQLIQFYSCNNIQLNNIRLVSLLSWSERVEIFILIVDDKAYLSIYNISSN